MAMRLIGPVYLIGGQDFNRIHLDWPANDANVYLIDTGDTFLMVDCGCGESLPAILDNVERMDFEVRDISHLLLTHEHFPHAAAADAVQKMEVEVMASAEAADAVREGDLRTAAFCYHHEFPACEGEIATLEDGQEIEVGAVTITAFALPGHSPGCMGYEMQADGVGGKRVVVGKEAPNGGYYVRGAVSSYVLIADAADVEVLRALLAPPKEAAEEAQEDRQ